MKIPSFLREGMVKVLGFIITKSLPIGWAIGNCTVDLTDKIKFLREIAGMLEER